MSMRSWYCGRDHHILARSRSRSEISDFYEKNMIFVLRFPFFYRRMVSGKKTCLMTNFRSIYKKINDFGGFKTTDRGGQDFDLYIWLKLTVLKDYGQETKMLGHCSELFCLSPNTLTIATPSPGPAEPVRRHDSASVPAGGSTIGPDFLQSPGSKPY